KKWCKKISLDEVRKIKVKEEQERRKQIIQSYTKLKEQLLANLHKTSNTKLLKKDRIEYFKHTPFYEVVILNWLTAYTNLPVNYQDAIKDFKNGVIDSYNEFEKRHIFRRLQRDEPIIKENWSSILYNIKGYKEILEIEQRIKNNRENPWQKMIENIAMKSWLKEFIDAFKHIQKNVVGISIESMTETEWYIDVLNPLLKTLFLGLKDESYTESSQQASKGSRSSSNSLTCSNCNSRRSSTSVTNNNENTVPSIYEKLTFVNLSTENFNLDNNSRSNRIHPDSKFLCKDIAHQFGIEVGVLEVSKSNSSSDKKERDRVKHILAMLISGAYVRHNFDSQYMIQSIQTLLE
ncbi:2432_t:CDS:2, partial [Gigaspora margarita]